MGISLSIRKLQKKNKMKLATIFATTALATTVDFSDPDRKFSDKPDFLSDEAWANYSNQPANVRVSQLRCRIDDFFDEVFAADERISTIMKNWNGVTDAIERSFEKCHGDLYDGQATCAYKAWMEKPVEQSTNNFATWYGVAVREFIYNSDAKRACQNHGLRLLKRLDRMNAYLQWNYCSKINDSDDCVFSWRWENEYKRNNHIRSDSAKHGIDKFDA